MVTHNFQNASNFTITGGQFGTVLGNINNFAYNVPDVFDIATTNANSGKNSQILPPQIPSSSSHEPSSPLSNNLHVDPKTPSPLGLELQDLQSSPQSPPPSLVNGKQTPPEEESSSDKKQSPPHSPNATYNHNAQPSSENEMATHFYLLQSGNIPLPSTSTSLISSSPQSYTTPTRMQINPPPPSPELQIPNPSSPNTINYGHSPGPGLFGSPNINQSQSQAQIQPIPASSPQNTHYTNESPIFAYHPPSTSSHHNPLPHSSIPDYTTIPSSIPIGGGGGGSNSFPSLPFPRHHHSHHQSNPQSYVHYQRPTTPLPRHSYTITMPELPQAHYNYQINGYEYSQLTRHQQQNYSPTNGYISTNHWTPIQAQNNSSMNMGGSHEYTLPVPLPVVPTPTLNQGYGYGSGSGSVYGGSRYEYGTRRF